jgi:hypothetical protein
MPSEPLLIGWKEYVEFPEWHLQHVRGKIDTGARTSALGVLDYELVDRVGVGPVARMRVALYRRRPERVRVVEAPVVRQAVVRNTGGVWEQRPVIETLMRIGPVHKRIQLTLARRTGMLSPLLLGRQALADSFVIDAARKYLLRH